MTILAAFWQFIYFYNPSMVIITFELSVHVVLRSGGAETRAAQVIHCGHASYASESASIFYASILWKLAHNRQSVLSHDN